MVVVVVVVGVVVVVVVVVVGAAQAFVVGREEEGAVEPPFEKEDAREERKVEASCPWRVGTGGAEEDGDHQGRGNESLVGDPS